jgi:hypothetical protein
MNEAFETIHALDATLANVTRSAGSLRLGLGMTLERLARSGGHHELGFASVEAYALERCERSSRWVQASRALARRLEELPAMRQAVMSGRVSFCMAQRIAKTATAEDENIWLAEAETRTVRQMQALVREREDAASDSAAEHLAASTGEARGTLTVTVAREEAWLFEYARTIVRHVAGATLEEMLEALVAEGTTSLLPEVPQDRVPSFQESSTELATQRLQRDWEAQLAAWREEAEARSEPKLLSRTEPCAATRDDELREHTARATSDDPVGLDIELRRLAAELARKDLSIGQLAEAFWKADGWRRLGYATESQYARERLGCSLSSIKAKRSLARRISALPRLAEALANRELGYEAARLVAAVATRDTEAHWIARARVRTVKHLREEVDAAEMLARLSGRGAMLPPSNDVMTRVARAESRVVSGEAFCGDDPGQMFADLAELASVAEAASSEDRRPPTHGRVTLRFRASVALIRYYRNLESAFQRHRPESMSFLRFLCTSLIDSWKRSLGTSVEYGRIYERDRFRCTSPVCTRRDVTPHHLRFRSHGGDDTDDNVASLCVWCHLDGIHAGRLTATPPATEIEWTVGRSGHTFVRGRVRAPSSAGLRDPAAFFAVVR